MAKKRKVAPRLTRFQPLTKNSMVLRSTVTRDAVAARFAAKKEGQDAAVRIAKARAAKAKKAPITDQAVGLNASARRNRDEAKSLKRYLAYDEGMYRNTPNGKVYYVKKAVKAQEKKAAAGIKTNRIYDDVKRKEFSAGRAAKMSKTNARISGGYATSMKRNAEAGLSHIVRGRALKNVARAGGALSLVSMFMNHINTKEKKNG